jgi:hypothetical protein
MAKGGLIVIEIALLGLLSFRFSIGLRLKHGDVALRQLRLLGYLDGSGNQRAVSIRRTHRPQGITKNPSTLSRIF